MKIYLGHSREFDYETKLYEPIRQSAFFAEHEFVFPHADPGDVQKTNDYLKNIDLFVAEVSYPSTGLGIELGWAHDLGKRIVCVYKTDSTPSGSLKSITDQILSYSNTEELLEIISTHES